MSDAEKNVSQQEEMEKLFLVLLKRQQMQEVVRIMGSEFGCPVCQNVLSLATLANCGHMFCQKCIRTWCVDYDRRNCPVCRVPIVARVRALPVDRFIRRCLEEAGDRELLTELQAAAAAANADNSITFESDRVQVKSTAATFYFEAAVDQPPQQQPLQQRPRVTVMSSGATSAGSNRVVGSFGVSSD